jgi:fumarylpyruvate hydrolase
MNHFVKNDRGFYAVIPQSLPTVAVAASSKRFPVHRIYCVGRNYIEHTVEVEDHAQAEREPPLFFMKPADTIAAPGGEVPYPPETHDFEHEVELVVAIGRSLFRASPAEALDAVFGYAVGLDLTRRDLQRQAREMRGPWDLSKSCDYSSPCGDLWPVSRIGHPEKGRIQLRVNGRLRQDSCISHLIWGVPELIHQLSRYQTLLPGDLIYTGTPGGVGPLVVGDRLEASIEGIGSLNVKIV